ncbi:MAG: iron ABC transporter permease [Alphaproteobacteria bacterium]|nr:iron ABC transporter permease [Alphaproteobacteria bacterium]
MSQTATNRPPTAKIPSVQDKWRLLTLGIPLMFAACLLMFIIHISVGAKSLDYQTIIKAFIDFDVKNFDHIIILKVRLPRAIIAIAVGASLAVAGAIMQGVTRNPLASPSILGLMSGASFAIVVALGVFGIFSPYLTPWIAAFGALCAAILVLVIASLAPGSTTPLNLTLAGVAVSAFLGAIISLLNLMDEDNFDQLRVWLTGSLAGKDLNIFYIISPWLIISMLMAVILSRKITILGMGEDVAKGLGVKPTGLKIQLMAVVIILTACSVAMAGPMGFIGLVVPHMVRLFIGADYRWVTPYSALLGATYLLAVDIIARLVIAPQEISTGIITALIGGPLFIYLIKSRGR